MKFAALLSSCLTLPSLAKVHTARGASNPKTIRKRKRALKARIGQIVAEAEMKLAKKAKTPKVSKPRLGLAPVKRTKAASAAIKARK